jgi:hypothetical protein
MPSMRMGICTRDQQPIKGWAQITKFYGLAVPTWRSNLELVAAKGQLLGLPTVRRG